MISVYHKFDVKAQTFDYTSGFAIPESVDSVPADLSDWSIPVVKALRVEHLGSYEHLGNAWSAANQFVRYKKLKQSKCGAFEICRNDPKQTPPAELCTEILAAEMMHEFSFGFQLHLRLPQLRSLAQRSPNTPNYSQSDLSL